MLPPSAKKLWGNDTDMSITLHNWSKMDVAQGLLMCTPLICSTMVPFWTAILSHFSGSISCF